MYNNKMATSVTPKYRDRELERHLSEVNKIVEAQLQKLALEEQLTIKLLLLGAAECGKSTVLKQMRILHDRGFTEKEMEYQKLIVCSNVITSITTIIEAMKFLGISFDVDRTHDAAVIFDVIQRKMEMSTLSEEVASAVKRLWSDAGVQNCYLKANLYHLGDSAKYFLDAVDRIADANYRPTMQDVLRARVATAGVVEVRFRVKNTTFRIIDVGGQRSERKKWIHVFDNVNAIIFIVAMSEYDQRLWEDETTNRIHESLNLFGSIINCEYFMNKNFILFLNKKDLFAEKIQRTPITIAFPKYTGPQSYQSCAMHIEQEFSNLNRNERRTIFVHHTCSTDTESVKFVIKSVLDTVLQENLKTAGLMS